MSCVFKPADASEIELDVSEWLTKIPKPSNDWCSKENGKFTANSKPEIVPALPLTGVVRRPIVDAPAGTLPEPMYGLKSNGRPTFRI